MDENKKVNTEVAQNDEFSKSAVPVSARKSFMSVLIISLGYVFVVTSMQAGSTIGVGLSFNAMVGAVLVSSLILTILSCIMGVIAARSGLSFGLLSRYSFGQAGTWVPVVIVAVTTIGWFSIDAWLIGDSAHRLFTALPILPIAILGGLGMTITAMKGTKWMNMLSNIAVPIILIFGVISIVTAFRDIGGIAGMNAIVKEDTLSFAKAVRVTRAKLGINTRPRASTTLYLLPGPTMEMTTRAKRMLGKAVKASFRRIKTSSMMPPK